MIYKRNLLIEKCKEGTMSKSNVLIALRATNVKYVVYVFDEEDNCDTYIIEAGKYKFYLNNFYNYDTDEYDESMLIVYKDVGEEFYKHLSANKGTLFNMISKIYKISET